MAQNSFIFPKNWLQDLIVISLKKIVSLILIVFIIFFVSSPEMNRKGG